MMLKAEMVTIKDIATGPTFIILTLKTINTKSLMKPNCNLVYASC